jgi:tetratricopeptide (TPR) repeat protein
MSINYRKTGGLNDRSERVDEKVADEMAGRIVYLMQIAQSMSDSNNNNWIEIENILKEALILSEVLKDNVEYNEFTRQVVDSYTGFCAEVGQLYLTQEEIYDPMSALEFLRRALEYDEKNAETWLDLGTAYANIAENVEALQCWQNALKYLQQGNPEDGENINRIEENMAIMRRTE